MEFKNDPKTPLSSTMRPLFDTDYKKFEQFTFLRSENSIQNLSGSGGIQHHKHHFGKKKHINLIFTSVGTKTK